MADDLLGEENQLTMRWTVRTEPTAVVLLSHKDGTVRVQHTCDGGGRWGEGETHVIAPALQTENGGHTVTQGDRGPTVSPSILCSDCGLHGFVTEGVWRDA